MFSQKTSKSRRVHSSQGGKESVTRRSTRQSTRTQSQNKTTPQALAGERRSTDADAPPTKFIAPAQKGAKKGRKSQSRVEGDADARPATPMELNITDEPVVGDINGSLECHLSAVT